MFLNTVLQLPYISWPRVVAQTRQGVRIGFTAHIIGIFGFVESEIIFNKRGNIFFSLPQGRDVYFNDIEPIEKIFPECFFPDTFFQDVHIRRAFSYCFDYDAMISDALNGEGIQSQGPIIAGMLGYREGEAPLHSYDPAKCEEEFKLADTDVWETGFYFQMAYNTGNDTRRLASEILKANIEAVNDKFNITVVGMPWPVLLNARRAGKLPIYVGGWLEDFHDPHNWAQPFLHSQGTYGRVINLKEDLAAEFDALVEEGAGLTDADERRAVYETIQLRAQEEATSIWLYQPVGRNHFQKWIGDYYYNPAYPNSTYSYIYAWSKGE